jgi:hypothetical protein
MNWTFSGNIGKREMPKLPAAPAVETKRRFLSSGVRDK